MHITLSLHFSNWGERRGLWVLKKLWTGLADCVFDADFEGSVVCTVVEVH